MIRNARYVMKFISWFTIPVLLWVTLSSACQNDEKQIQSTLFNFLDAKYVNASPQQAYVYISDQDKSFISIDEYSKDFAFEKESDLKFRILDYKIKANQAQADVEFKKEGNLETKTFFLSRNKNGKFRILLDIKTRTQVIAELSKIKKLASSGELNDALLQLEQMDSKPFYGSLPSEHQANVAITRGYIEALSRKKNLQLRLANFVNLDSKAMKNEMAVLDTEILEEEAKLRSQFKKLNMIYRKKFKEETIDAMEVSKLKVKKTSDGWGTITQASFDITSYSTRKIKAISVKFYFQNSKDEAPIKVIKRKLSGLEPTTSNSDVKEGTKPTQIPNKKTFVSRITPPKDWKGKTFSVTIEDIKIDWTGQ